MNAMTQKWDTEYSTGRLDYLTDKHEQTRFALISAFIANYAPGEVIDLGGGTGELLRWCHQGTVNRYTCVDVSEVALERITSDDVEIERKAISLTEFTPEPRDVGCVVASEVLYYVDDPAAQMRRIVEACSSVRGAAISVVAGRPDKPNWEKSSRHIWAQFDALDWPLVQSANVHNHDDGTNWDLRFYLFD